MIAKKHRNDRILGIFDYVLYSGDPNYILCKPGVPQNTGTAPYDIGTCTVTDIAN
jgi:hypothetical protein